MNLWSRQDVICSSNGAGHCEQCYCGAEVGGADGIQGRRTAGEPKMRRVVRSLVGSVIEDAETMIDGAHEDSVRGQRFAI